MQYRIRDPIHGFIEVSALELKIIDSYPFQRLRNIKQLATTYLVYPGAEHTRFGHSLGVMHLVSKAFDSAVNNYRIIKEGELFESVKALWYRQILRLIALTHDLGHAPFSHASEALFDEKIEHEHYTMKIIFETEIAQYIKDIGDEFKRVHNVSDEYNITPELLWMIYGEKNPEMNPQYILPDYKFLKSFMDSELDCDKMDYLLRDSHYCGVEYGVYDINRLILSLNVYRNESHNIMQLAIDRGGIHSFEEFAIARYFMFIQVYYHKTRRYLDNLLVQNIISILPDSKYPDDVHEYMKYDDLVILGKIKEKQDEGNVSDQFLKRQVRSCVYETTAHSTKGNDNYLINAIKHDLKKELGCDIFEDTAEKLTMKMPSLEEYDSGSGKGIPILVNYLEEPSSLSRESVLLQNLRIPINIKRIYVEKQYAEKAREIIRKLLNGGEDSDEKTS